MTMTNGHARWRGALRALNFDDFEKTAERRLNDLVRDGKSAYKEALKRLDGTTTASNLRRLAADSQDRLNELVRKAGIASTSMRRRAERLQDATLQSMGFATRSQMANLTREVKRLVRKAGAPRA